MRYKILVAGVAFFVAAASAITGVGLVFAASREAGWRPVYTNRATHKGTPRTVRAALLRSWRDVRADPPKELQQLDGAFVELVGLARPAGSADGFWLVSNPFALHEGIHPPINDSVWVELPRELRGNPHKEEILTCGRILRARGHLKIGLSEVPGGQAAYRLETSGLWARDGRVEGHGHGPHCCH